MWESLRATGTIVDPTPTLKDRLTRMRSWIASEHFPEEMRIHLCSSPTQRRSENSPKTSGVFSPSSRRPCNLHLGPPKASRRRSRPPPPSAKPVCETCTVRVTPCSWEQNAARGWHPFSPTATRRDDGTGSSSNGPVMQGEHQTRLLCCIIQHTIQKVSPMYLRHGRRVLSHCEAGVEVTAVLSLMRP